MPIIMNMKGTRPLTGPALTNDLCGQYFKIKVNVNTIPVGATLAVRPPRSMRF